MGVVCLDPEWRVSVSYCFADIIHEQDWSFPREDSPLRASSAALPSPVQRWETDLWLHMNHACSLGWMFKESVIFTSAAHRGSFVDSFPLLKQRVDKHFCLQLLPNIFFLYFICWFIVFLWFSCLFHSFVSSCWLSFVLSFVCFSFFWTFVRFVHFFCLFLLCHLCFLCLFVLSLF